jgi:hypothetical protein
MSIEERLDAVERELAITQRRSRWLLSVAGSVVAAAGLAWGLTETTPLAHARGIGSDLEVVRASEFIVEDGNGRVCARLGNVEGQPTLALFNEDGEPATLLSVSDIGPMLALYRNGHPAAALSSDESGTGLSLQDENGKVRVCLVLHGTESGLVMFDESGTGRVGLVALEDTHGLALFDGNGTGRAALATEAEDPSIQLCDESGKSVWSAP